MVVSSRELIIYFIPVALAIYYVCSFSLKLQNIVLFIFCLA
ncbi:unnamed protein product, partial [marine sediment metagenome]